MSPFKLVLRPDGLTTTDTVEWGGWRFEVVDMDGKRIDKVLVSRLPEPPTMEKMDDHP